MPEAHWLGLLEMGEEYSLLLIGGDEDSTNPPAT